MLEWSGSARLRAESSMFCSRGSRRAQRKQELSVALTCPRCVQKVRVKLHKRLGENGRHVGTRTPDLYRVNFEVTTLKPFSYLACPHFIALKNALTQASFDGELMARFSDFAPARFPGLLV
jgi:hypothetical protein